LQSRDCNLCKELRKINCFQEKSEKKRNFLPKSFADTEKSRTFASQSRNKGLHKQDNPKLYYCIRSLKYLHVSVIMKRLLFAAVILFTDSANVR
jgi:hypothetical protein